MIKLHSMQQQSEPVTNTTVPTGFRLTDVDPPAVIAENKTHWYIYFGNSSLTTNSYVMKGKTK
jgi:hypothetical protein